jgi:hypothetical protein
LGFERSTAISGVLEFAFCATVAIWRYVVFMALRGAQLNALSHGALRGAGEGTQLYFQTILTVEYLLRPLSILLVYFAVEGAIRAIAVFSTDQTLPSLPLALAALLLANRPHTARSISESEPPDQVTISPQEGVDLKITRCKIWQMPMTLEFHGELFELLRIERGDQPQSYAYLFRKQPQGAVIRRLVSYDVRAHVRQE